MSCDFDQGTCVVCLYGSYATDGLKHGSRFFSDTPFCAYFKYNSKISITRKPRGACNSATHQTTPLLPKMLWFMLKAANQLQPARYGPVQTSLSCYFVHMYEWQQNWGRLSNNCCPTKVASLKIQTEVPLTSCGAAQRVSWCLCTTFRLH